MKKKSIVRILGDAQETMDMLVELVPEVSKREALRAAILVCAARYHIDLTPFLDLLPMDAEYNKKQWRAKYAWTRVGKEPSNMHFPAEGLAVRADFFDLTGNPDTVTMNQILQVAGYQKPDGEGGWKLTPAGYAYGDAGEGDEEANEDKTIYWDKRLIKNQLAEAIKRFKSRG